MMFYTYSGCFENKLLKTLVKYPASTKLTSSSGLIINAIRLSNKLSLICESFETYYYSHVSSSPQF